MSQDAHSYQLIAHTFNSHDVSVLVRNDGELWWVAKDVCEALGIKDSKTSVRSLDDDEKGEHTVPTPGGPQRVSIISEPGMYSLVLRSRKPEAKAFKRWVTHEVLPSIRKTGTYTTSLPAPAPEEPESPYALALALDTTKEWLRPVAISHLIGVPIGRIGIALDGIRELTHLSVYRYHPEGRYYSPKARRLLYGALDRRGWLPTKMKATGAPVPATVEPIRQPELTADEQRALHAAKDLARRMQHLTDGADLAERFGLLSPEAEAARLERMERSRTARALDELLETPGLSAKCVGALRRAKVMALAGKAFKMPRLEYEQLALPAPPAGPEAKYALTDPEEFGLWMRRQFELTVRGDVRRKLEEGNEAVREWLMQAVREAVFTTYVWQTGTPFPDGVPHCVSLRVREIDQCTAETV